jgi:polysaccharide export outer membrane protein
MTSCRSLAVLSLLLTAAALAALGQVPQAGAPAQTPQNQPALAQVPLLNTARPDYELGANDQILVRAPNADEINERPFRVDADGFITFPIVGRMRVSGLTVRGLEQELVLRLREYIRDPQVGITVVQFRSEPVSFLGAFRNPGIYPLQGGRTLVEMLTVIGGLQPDASRRIRVTRRLENGPLPLANAISDQEMMTSTAEISLDRLMQDINPEEDIVLQAYDRVTALQESPVYVTGDVARPAALVLGARQSISVTQAVTEAGGLTAAASRNKLHVLRPVSGTSRRAEIEVDFRRILEGKDNDFPLLPNDVLYVPRAGGARSIFTSPLTMGMLSSLPFVIVTAIR